MEQEKSCEENLKGDDERGGKSDSAPIAAGVGVVGGGAAGAAIGTAVGGPVGTVVGAIIGAVAGGAGGYAVGGAIDPAAEDSYWRENHYNQPFAKGGNYDEYQAGYRTGYQGYGKYAEENQTFEEAEPDLERSYSESETDLPWDKARDASRMAWERAARGEAVKVPISEEEVNVGKREVQHGEARIRKEVHTETVNTPIDLKREELVIERIDTGGGEVPEDAFREGEVRVPLMKEEAVVQKQARVVGEVRIGKKAETSRENLSSTIRKEEVKVDSEPDSENS